jgi:hypothetical protein
MFSLLAEDFRQFGQPALGILAPGLIRAGGHHSDHAQRIKPRMASQPRRRPSRCAAPRFISSSGLGEPSAFGRGSRRHRAARYYEPPLVATPAEAKLHLSAGVALSEFYTPSGLDGVSWRLLMFFARGRAFTADTNACRPPANSYPRSIVLIWPGQNLRSCRKTARRWAEIVLGEVTGRRRWPSDERGKPSGSQGGRRGQAGADTSEAQAKVGDLWWSADKANCLAHQLERLKNILIRLAGKVGNPFVALNPLAKLDEPGLSRSGAD